MSNHTAKLLTGAVGSAIGASVCCLGPLLLAVSGLGGGALLLRFAPYRPFFLVGTAGLLAGSFYFTYRKPASEDCEPGSVCANSSSRRLQRIMLWIVTVLVLLVAMFPYYAELLF